MELSTIKEAFNRVTKKQKLCHSKSQEVIDQLSHELQLALATIQTTQDSTSPVLVELKTKLNAIGPNTQFEGPQRELNLNITKSQKLLDKNFNPDISKASRNIDFDTHTVNHIIINHLYRVGLFDIADAFVKEAAEPEVVSLRSRFLEMHRILNSMRGKKLEPAIYWASTNRESLKMIGSDLEIKLHKLQFVVILQEKSRDEALKYAKTCLAPFASLHLDEIKKLMCCLLWAGKIEKSPYSDLVRPVHWEKLTEEVTRVFCGLLGQSYESPLSVALGAGFEGLPTLLKLAQVIAKQQEWMAMQHLPVPVDLGKKFQFHSIFVCPVSREQACEKNPPMLLRCGHVICKGSVGKLSKNYSRVFKCPYCPVESSGSECRQIYL